MKSERSSTKAKTHKSFVIGIDFGTLSGRAAVIDASNGQEMGAAVYTYKSGVIDSHLPDDKKKLPSDVALQDPKDYWDVLTHAVPKALKLAGIDLEQVQGIGIDFTACTILPTQKDGTPLCHIKKWSKHPHAWVKLWKHHAAQPEADRINELGRHCEEAFIPTYGGKYSSEWFFSKVLEIVRDEPALYEATERFIEAGDWMVWKMTGRETRSYSLAGFKAMCVYPDERYRWTYPSHEFFNALDPMLKTVVEDKMSRKHLPLGTVAGELLPEVAKKMGLPAGIPVATANIDAHAAVPGCGVTGPGKLVMVMGTSTCHLLVSESRQEVEGICGVVQDGVIPGYWGYEAGQAGVGDAFAWFMEHAVPPSVHSEAKANKMDVYAWLEKQAAKLKPGDHGLLALDWWNGNRSILVDSDLSGVLLGLNIGTRPHEIYRAIMEGTAFGTRRIIEAFTEKHVEIEEIHACGGLANHNPLLLQIYADVTGRTIQVANSEHTSALGAAMFASVAGGIYPDIQKAAQKMAPKSKKTFKPNPQAKEIYDEVYAEYLRLHDHFGRDVFCPLKKLKRIRQRVQGS